MSKTPPLSLVNGTSLSGANQKVTNVGVLQAMKSAGMQEDDRTVITADTPLLVDGNAGLVLVDCTSGNILLTLPVSGDETDDAIFLICRLDNTGNTLSYVRGGSDTVEGSTGAGTIAGRGILGLQMPAGGTDWKVYSRSGGTKAGARAAIDAAGSGANADITSLTGLTTAITVAQGGAGIQTIPTPTFNAGAMTIPSASFTLYFRNASLGSGAPTPLTATAAALVVPSGATLGLTSGKQSDLVLLALFPSVGVIEYALYNQAVGGVDLNDAAAVISTTVLDAASDSAGVAYSATARTNVPFRVIGLYRGTQTTAGTWAQAMSLIQGAGGMFKPVSPCYLRLTGPNGNGATNTTVRRYTTVDDQSAGALTHTDSAANGGSVVVNIPDFYTTTYFDSFSIVANMAISVNSSSLTTMPGVSEVVCEATTSATDRRSCISNRRYYKAGDIIRSQCDASTNGAGRSMLEITRG